MSAKPPASEPGDGPVEKTDAEWRAKLTPEQYRVTREKGTERAFTGKYWNEHAKGEYRCVCCGALLFTSDSKFDSGCGWPSFDRKAKGAPIDEHVDESFGMVRTEVVCHRCGAHLGHVFDDGPTSTGLRYCINSASIDLRKDEAPKAAPKDPPAK
jgi:peptide-methionine (R)-S-oxide reductase